MREILRRRDRLALALYVLSALLLVAVLVFWRESLAGFLWRGLAPLVGLRAAPFSSEFADLRVQLEAARALSADRTLLYEENLHLKRLLGREAGRNVMLAGILQRPPGIPYDTLMIDAGERHGLIGGELVSAGGGILIGRVAQVYKTTARVVLFSAPGETYSALVASSRDSMVPVLLEGQGGGSMLGQLPEGSGVQAGDEIVISGIGTGLIGNVTSVTTHENEPFETLYVRLPVNFYHLRFVEIWPTS